MNIQEIKQWYQELKIEFKPQIKAIQQRKINQSYRYTPSDILSKKKEEGFGIAEEIFLSDH